MGKIGKIVDAARIIKYNDFVKKVLLTLFLIVNGSNVFSQSFSRIIEIKNARMYGADIFQLQTRLKSCSFDGIGEIDGYYGPLTEKVVKDIQYFWGFDQNGKVNKELWDLLFSESRKNILRNISILSEYDLNTMEKESGLRMGYSTEGGNVDKYFMEGDVKIIKLNLCGETFQIDYLFYYLDSNYFFVIEKLYKYPFPLYYLSTSGEYSLEEFTSRTATEHKVHLNDNTGLFQLINGSFAETDFVLDEIIEIVEDKNAN